MPPIRARTHPGDVLREEYLKPLGMSARARARAIRVTPTRTAAIMADDNPCAVIPGTAMRLARYFRTTPEFRLSLQNAYDLSMARQEIGVMIEAEIPLIAA